MKWKGNPILGRCVEANIDMGGSRSTDNHKGSNAKTRKIRVSHYWTQENQHDKWGIWLPKEEWKGAQNQELVEGFWR
jgi:hypothetical protein